MILGDAAMDAATLGFDLEIYSVGTSRADLEHELAALASNTPLSAGHVHFVGPSAGVELLTQGIQRRNPQVRVTLLADDDAALTSERSGRDADAVAWRTSDEQADELASRASVVAQRLGQNGRLIASGPAADVLPDKLGAAGLRLVPPSSFPSGARAYDDQLIRADREGGVPLALHMAALSPRFMDIRTRLPFRELATEPSLAVSYEEGGLHLPDLAQDAPKVLVIQRPWFADSEAWQQNAARLAAKGWIVVIEFDDHPALVDRARGVSAPDGWRQFSTCHAVQTSTDDLQDVLRPLNDETVVFPNAVFDLPPLPKRTGAPRIFYGAFSRGNAAVQMAASLSPFTKRFPRAEFVVVGDRAVFNALPTKAKQFHEALDFDGYQRLMRSCDIALSPLQDDDAGRCKSDAKQLDAARNGVALIASPTVYAKTISHGHNGFIASELSEWSQILLRLTVDAGLRKATAKRAWEEVRDHRMFVHQVGERRDWYESLWRRRTLLTGRAMERAPIYAQTLHELAPDLAHAARHAAKAPNTAALTYRLGEIGVSALRCDTQAER